MAAIEEIKDLSDRALSLARHVDRLPPGEYTVRLSKSRRPKALAYEIDSTETVAKSVEVGDGISKTD